MTPEAKKKSGLIDSYRKLQKISSDEVFKFILEGLLYDIDIKKDFSSIRMMEQPITDMPIASIIGYLNSLESERESYKTYISLVNQDPPNLEVLKLLNEDNKTKKHKKRKKKKSKKKKEEERKRRKEFIDRFFTSSKNTPCIF